MRRVLAFILAAAARSTRSQQLCFGLAATLLSGFLFSCSQRDSAPPPALPSAPQVTTTVVIETNMPLTLHAVGHVSPFASVPIRSRVSGQLERVHFKEGDKLNTGDLMFTIDPRPFATALECAKSQLEKDLALQKQAAIEQQQNAVLLQNKIISQDNYTQSAAYADSLKAALATDRAAVAQAQLELSFCEIHAPIAGRAGLLQVNPGAVLTAGDMVLVTLNQTQPVFIDFLVSEGHLTPLRRAIAAGPLTIRAALPGQDETCWTGALVALDNAVEPDSGTILLRAIFDNPGEALWPGQSANVSLTLPALTKAVLAPQQAVQSDTNGNFVLVVNPDATIDSRPVQTGDQVGPDVVVYQGLHSGERVVLGSHRELGHPTKVRAM